MQNFLRIAQGVDTIPVMNTLFRHEELWNQHRFRTTFPNTPHVDVDDIWLRFSDPSKLESTGTVIGDNAPIWYPAVHQLPEVRPIILDLMRRVDAHELGRVLITRIKPGGRILPHRDDQGDYVHEKHRMRYHIVLQGLPGSLYRTGDETVCMLTGEVWTFDAFTEHEVLNNSTDDRVHLLVDVTVWPTP